MCPFSDRPHLNRTIYAYLSIAKLSIKQIECLTSYCGCRLRMPKAPCINVGSRTRQNWLPIEVCQICPGQRVKKLDTMQAQQMPKLVQLPPRLSHPSLPAHHHCCPNSRRITSLQRHCPVVQTLLSEYPSFLVALICGLWHRIPGVGRQCPGIQPTRLRAPRVESRNHLRPLALGPRTCASLFHFQKLHTRCAIREIVGENRAVSQLVHAID